MRLEFLDFSLDTASGELYRDGVAIHLEPKVLAFLTALLERPAEVVTKEELLDSLWPDAVVTEGSLTRVASLARAALRDGGAEPKVIRTRYRRGYQIDVPVTVRESPVPGFGGRPAIAVLPFENLSGDPDQDYLADGLVEELITGLAVRRYFPVIARNSTFTYKGRHVDLRQVGRELGARYVVEGSVRRAGERLRVAVQLIEAETGHHVWADRYDGELAEILAFQDETVFRVCAAIEPELRLQEPARASRGAPKSLDSWEAVARGMWHLNQMTRDSTSTALEFYERALALDPDFVPALSLKAIALQIRFFRGWESDAALARVTVETARRAVALDPRYPYARHALGVALLLPGRLEESLAENEKSLELDPSSALAHWATGRTLYGLGRHEEAIDHCNRAIRLSPRDVITPIFLSTRAHAEFALGRYEEALASCEKSVAEYRENYAPFAIAAACCTYLGRDEEARAYLVAALRAHPDLSLAAVATRSKRNADEDNVRRMVEGLRRAGLR